MPVDLYYMPASAPCRTVQLVAAAVDVKLNLHELDLRTGAHLKPEFLKINPQHTIPTIVDDGFSLWESRAIARYLASKYGKGGSLYPTDLKTRAVVEQRLDFDQGTLYHRFAQYYYPQMMENASPNEEHRKKLEEALGFLNTFLEESKYVAGASLTIADLSIVATLSTIEATGTDLSPYPNIQRWYALVKTTAPHYKETNGKGVEHMKQFIAEMKAKK